MIPSKENMELANLVGDWLKNEVAPVCGEYDEKNEFPEKLYEQNSLDAMKSDLAPQWEQTHLLRI